MGYTLNQISELLLKADKTLYRLGSIAYDDMFAEDSETLDYERDIIFLYQKSINWAKDNHLGERNLDKTCERLSVKVNMYDYGSLTPIYSDVIIYNVINTSNIYALKATKLTINGITYDLSQDRVWDLTADMVARNVTNHTAVAAQTIFGGYYTINQTDVFYNGARLNIGEDFTATDGFYINLTFPATVGDKLTVISYVSTFGLGGGGTAGSIAKFNGTSTLTNAVSNMDYQAPISLTTTGVGAATFNGQTLNIPRDNYIHDQQVALITWIITHNMNKYPSVNIVDTANDEVTGDVKYNSLNQITISFTAAFSGKAYLN